MRGPNSSDSDNRALISHINEQIKHINENIHSESTQFYQMANLLAYFHETGKMIEHFNRKLSQRTNKADMNTPFIQGAGFSPSNVSKLPNTTQLQTWANRITFNLSYILYGVVEDSTFFLDLHDSFGSLLTLRNENRKRDYYDILNIKSTRFASSFRTDMSYRSDFDIQNPCLSKFDSRHAKDSLIEINNDLSENLKETLSEHGYIIQRQVELWDILACPPLDMIRFTRDHKEYINSIKTLMPYCQKSQKTFLNGIRSFFKRTTDLANEMGNIGYEMRDISEKFLNSIKTDSILNCEQRKLLFTLQIMKKAKISPKKKFDPSAYKAYRKEAALLKKLSESGDPSTVRDLCHLIDSFAGQIRSETRLLTESLESKKSAMSKLNRDRETRVKTDATNGKVVESLEVTQMEAEYVACLEKIQKCYNIVRKMEIDCPAHDVQNEVFNATNDRSDKIWGLSRINRLKEMQQGLDRKREDFCPMCRNPREVVIGTCGHTYCKECVERMLHTRSRKCLHCSKPFEREDVWNL